MVSDDGAVGAVESNISFLNSEKLPLISHWMDFAVLIIVKDYF